MFIESEIKKACLDKQQVKDAVERLRVKYPADIMTLEGDLWSDKLLEELGLQ